MCGPVVNKVWCGVGEAVKGGVGGSSNGVGRKVEKGGRPRRVGGPISRLFFLLPSEFSLFFSLSLSGCLLVEFWWCLKRRGRSNVHVWSSLVVV